MMVIAMALAFWKVSWAAREMGSVTESWWVFERVFVTGSVTDYEKVSEMDSLMAHQMGFQMAVTGLQSVQVSVHSYRAKF